MTQVGNHKQREEEEPSATPFPPIWREGKLSFVVSSLYWGLGLIVLPDLTKTYICIGFLAPLSVKAGCVLYMANKLWTQRRL
jgi:hypothetical protein